jgi:hypothetical protein
MSNPTTWSCFGKLWDPSRVECSGGFDLAFTDKRTQTAKRLPCSAVGHCQQQTLLRKQEQNLIPPNHLVRPPQMGPTPPAPPAPPALPPAMPPMMGVAPIVQRAPQVPQYAPPQQPYYPPQQYAQQYTQQHYAPQQNYGHAQYVPPALAQFGPAHVPMAYQAHGAQMPAYLAMPEPMDGSPWWSRLSRELLRAMAKAFGHATASFFDHNPMRLHQPPALPPMQQQPAAPPPT